jgi:hypothetical protein
VIGEIEIFDVCMVIFNEMILYVLEVLQEGLLWTTSWVSFSLLWMIIFAFAFHLQFDFLNDPLAA